MVDLFPRWVGRPSHFIPLHPQATSCVPKESSFNFIAHLSNQRGVEFCVWISESDGWSRNLLLRKIHRRYRVANFSSYLKPYCFGHSQRRIQPTRFARFDQSCPDCALCSVPEVLGGYRCGYLCRGIGYGCFHEPSHQYKPKTFSRIYEVGVLTWVCC